MSVAPFGLDAVEPADFPELALTWARALVEDAQDAAARRQALEAARNAVRETAPAPIDRLISVRRDSPAGRPWRISRRTSRVNVRGSCQRASFQLPITLLRAHRANHRPFSHGTV